MAFLWKNLPGWPVEFVSENVKELFGYSAEEFMSGKVIYSKTISHEDLPRVTEEVNAYGKGSAERFTHMPYRIVAKDGTVKWVVDRTYIRRDKNGVITYHQGIVEDITERKRTEDALQEREEQFRLIYQMIPDPVNIVRTRDGICLDVNDRFVIHTGWTREVVVGKKFKNLNIWCNPGDRERMIEAVFRDGRIDNLEAVFRLKNGEKITALLSATALTIGGERLIVSITKDITERNRAQAALKESEEKYRFVVDNANEWMVLTQNERVVFAKPGPEAVRLLHGRARPKEYRGLRDSHGLGYRSGHLTGGQGADLRAFLYEEGYGEERNRTGNGRCLGHCKGSPGVHRPGKHPWKGDDLLVVFSRDQRGGQKEHDPLPGALPGERGIHPDR